jgi:hypothetical protein
MLAKCDPPTGKNQLAAVDLRLPRLPKHDLSLAPCPTLDG